MPQDASAGAHRNAGGGRGLDSFSRVRPRWFHDGPVLSHRRRPRPESSGEQAPMKITDIKTTTVTVPLEAPLRHSVGSHWGRFVRTIVEVETDEGVTGLGEMGGGGESAE